MIIQFKSFLFGYLPSTARILAQSELDNWIGLLSESILLLSWCLLKLTSKCKLQFILRSLFADLNLSSHLAWFKGYTTLYRGDSRVTQWTLFYVLMFMSNPHRRNVNDETYSWRHVYLGFAIRQEYNFHFLWKSVSLIFPEFTLILSRTRFVTKILNMAVIFWGRFNFQYSLVCSELSVLRMRPPFGAQHALTAKTIYAGHKAKMPCVGTGTASARTNCRTTIHG